MKIAVMSDTHGNVQLAVSALKSVEKIDKLIHLGDYYRDALQIGNKIGVPVHAVSGNTDLDSNPRVDREMVLELGGARFFITHGDLYRVKQGIDLLVEKAIMEVADVALFGHTHFSFKQRIGNILYINPGCILSNNPNNSFAILNLSNNRVEAEIVFI